MRQRQIGKTMTLAIAAGAFTVMAGAGAAMAVFSFKGSDTLFDPITQAVTNSGFALSYLGTGSGNGEKALQAIITPKQFIAPMSRNLAAAVISAHPTWAPTKPQILGLDGLVMVEKGGTGACSSDPEGSIPFVNGATDGQRWMRYAITGADGTGSIAACQHQKRLDAIAALANCNTAPNLTLNHFYRRDDNSGTSDSVKDFLGAGNFCNNNLDSFSHNVSKGPTNLDNADGDPLRGPCVSVAGFKATPCRVSDHTLGFVVALTEADTGATDATTSIGRRVALDRATLGYAGREASIQAGARAVNVNTRTPTVNNIRTGFYPLARRLFLSRGDNDISTMGDPSSPDPTSEQLKFMAWTTATNAGVPLQDPPVQAEINKFPFCYDTNDENTANLICGRCFMDPVMKSKGFIPCTDDCTQPAASNNLCFSVPGGFVAFVPTALGATGASCTTGAQCVSGTCTASACSALKADGFACAANSECAGGNCDPLGGPNGSQFPACGPP